MESQGFFRDDPVFRSRVQGADFFQSGRHKSEEHFWRNINRGTPHRVDDGYVDGYDGYDQVTGRYGRTDRRGNRYLSGTSTSSHPSHSSDEELNRDLKLTKEKEGKKDDEEEEDKEDEEDEDKKEEKKKKIPDTDSVYGGSVYDGSVYAGSVYGGSVYGGDGVWPRRRKSFFKICNAAPTFYPNLSR